MIQWMLTVDPIDRPSCDQILVKIDQIKPELIGDNYMDADKFEPIQESHDPMLGTINLPPDLKLLDKKLPRSNYGNKNQLQISVKTRHNSAFPPTPSIKYLKAGGPEKSSSLSSDSSQDAAPKGDLPPLLNPSFKINYHDKFKGINNHVNSKSLDGPSNRLQKRLRDELMPHLPGAGQHLFPQAARLHVGPNIENGQTFKEYSLQERIRMINENNIKKIKVVRNNDTLVPIQNPPKPGALPPLLPNRQSYDPSTAGQGLPSLASKCHLSDQKKIRHVIQPPEWWG